MRPGFARYAPRVASRRAIIIIVRDGVQPRDEVTDNDNAPVRYSSRDIRFSRRVVKSDDEHHLRLRRMDARGYATTRNNVVTVIIIIILIASPPRRAVVHIAPILRQRTARGITRADSRVSGRMERGSCMANDA